LTLERRNIRKRHELRKKLAEAFSDTIRTLPAEMQYILLDDLVTAFENRLSVFSSPKQVQVSADFVAAVNSEEITA